MNYVDGGFHLSVRPPIWLINEIENALGAEGPVVGFSRHGEIEGILMNVKHALSLIPKHSAKRLCVPPMHLGFDLC